MLSHLLHTLNHGFPDIKSSPLILQTILHEDTQHFESFYKGSWYFKDGKSRKPGAYAG
jgi:hypothetical protein